MHAQHAQPRDVPSAAIQWMAFGIAKEQVGASTTKTAVNKGRSHVTDFDGPFVGQRGASAARR